MHEEDVTKHYGLLKDSMLILYNLEKPISFYDAIYLNECILKEDFIYGAFVLSIFHSTKIDQRISFAFKSEEKRKWWIEKIRKAGNLRKFKEHYLIGNKIGSGKFAEVFIATNKLNGIQFAVKVIKKRRLDRYERESMNNEISVLTTLQHPGIVKFVDAFYSKSRMYIVLDLVSGINLSQKVICGETSEKEIKSIVYQLLKIVKYMHSIGVIHRDIKLENIMMTEDSKIFLIDFGLATFSFPKEVKRLNCGTLNYSAPELLSKQGYNTKADI